MSFSKFIELPLELRILVWEHVFPPRPAELRMELYVTPGGRGFRTARLPAIFHISRESRQEAFLHAHSRGLIHRLAEDSINEDAVVFFDPESTILVLEHNAKGRSLDLTPFISRLGREVQEKVRHIKFIQHDEVIHRIDGTKLVRNLSNFPKLRTFIPILNDLDAAGCAEPGNRQTPMGIGVLSLQILHFCPSEDVKSLAWLYRWVIRSLSECETSGWDDTNWYVKVLRRLMRELNRMEEFHHMRVTEELAQLDTNFQAQS